VAKEEFIQQLTEQAAASAAEHRAQHAATETLHRDLVDKEELIQRLARDIAEIRRDREHRDEEIRALIAAIGVERLDQQNAIAQLHHELVKKEEVIQAFIAATSTQAQSAPASRGKITRAVVTRSRRLLVRTGRPFLVWARRATRAVTGYRLGQFVMHSPRRLSLPARYRVPLGATGSLRISIVTPVFNQAQFIGATIESVLSQQYPALEYIVMDGGSDDGSKEIIEQYRTSLAGFESARDSGQANAINKGMARATGEVLAWLNGDDLLLPGALDYVAHFFETNPEVDVIYGNRIVIDRDGRQIGRWILPEHDGEILSWADYVPQETLFWRRRIWDRIGGRLDESFQFAMDWDLLVRFRDAGARFTRLPRYLGAFRVHDDQKTTKEIGTKGAAEMDRIRFRCLGYLPTYIDINRKISPYMLRHVALHNLDRVSRLWRWSDMFAVPRT
jgi:glycosyltransferase involved in cell wall biosynthesis